MFFTEYRIRKLEDKLKADRREYQEGIRVDTEAIKEWEKGLKKDRKALEEFESLLASREAVVSSDEKTIDNFRDLLDRRQVELDDRDARVIAAMGGKAVVGGG